MAHFLLGQVPSLAIRSDAGLACAPRTGGRRERLQDWRDATILQETQQQRQKNNRQTRGCTLGMQTGATTRTRDRSKQGERHGQSRRQASRTMIRRYVSAQSQRARRRGNAGGSQVAGRSMPIVLEGSGVGDLDGYETELESDESSSYESYSRA